MILAFDGTRNTRIRRSSGNLAALAATLALLACLPGCQSPQADKQQATQRWNAARSSVKAQLASEQLASGNLAAAGDAITEARRLTPNEMGLDLLEGKLELSRGNQLKAREHLSRVPDFGPDGAEAQYLMGVSYLAQQGWDASLPLLRRATELAPDSDEYAFALIDALLLAGQPDEAAARIRARAAAGGWTLALHAAMARCHDLTGQRDEAAREWAAAVDGDSSGSVSDSRAAMALYRANRLSEAGPKLRARVESADGGVSMAERIADVDCLIASRRVDQAACALSPLLESDPCDACVKRRAALVAAHQGHWGEALRIVREILNTDAQDLPTLELGAAIAHRAGDVRAMEDFARRIAKHAHGGDSPVLARLRQSGVAAAAQ
ncbi:MAG: tetratricopeptide repeat protein [Phycisphaerae bacterium]